MKSITIWLITTLMLLGAAGLSVQGYADNVYGCYENEKGRIRISDGYSECLKSEEILPLSEIRADIEEHCFEVEVGDGFFLGLLRIGLSPVGEGHYIVKGKAYYDSLEIIRGSAATEGNRILLATTHISEGDTSLSTSTSRTIIDKGTYDGISRFVTHRLNYSDMSISRDHGIASLTSTPCPE